MATASFALTAQIVVEGIADRSIANAPVTFRVPPLAGSERVATLDGISVPLGTAVQVTAPDYHELRVAQLDATGAPVETRLLRFIVRAADRGDSEWGLPPWTPPPIVPASTEELAAARLRLITPAAFPAGVEFPLVAWLDAPDGHALRASTVLTGTAHPPIILRRGAGAGRVPTVADSETLRLVSAVPGHSIARDIRLETAPAWFAAGGTLAGAVVWPADSRVDMTRSLTVPADASLVIGAGTVVRLAAGVDFVVEGRVAIDGDAARPVSFIPAAPDRPWGGFILRNAGARLDATHAILVGSGAEAAWFDIHPGYDVHRREQALFLVDGARVNLTDCAAFDGHGQFGHGRNGFISLNGCLVQRFLTGGE